MKVGRTFIAGSLIAMFAVSTPVGAASPQAEELVAGTVWYDCLGAGGRAESMVEKADAHGWGSFERIDPAAFHGTIDPDYEMGTSVGFGGVHLSMTVIRTVVESPTTGTLDHVQCTINVEQPELRSAIEARLSEALGNPTFPLDHAWVMRVQSPGQFIPLNTSGLGAEPRLPRNPEILAATISAPETFAVIQVREYSTGVSVMTHVYSHRP